MKKLLFLIATILASHYFAQGQALPIPLRAVVVDNIRATSTVIDNRSTLSRASTLHTFCATGTGSWSAQLQYSTSATSGWTNFTDVGSLVSNASANCVGVGNGYHAYIRFSIAGTVSISYRGIKDLYIYQPTGSTTPAPADATYITNTPNATLTQEQALSLLSTGLAVITTSTGQITTVAAPTGTILGTTDAQTISNKNIDASNTIAANAATASALAANPANCSAGQIPRGITAAGVAEGCAAVNLVTETTGAAPTATALAADPANCSVGTLPRGVDASGVGQGCAAVNLATETTGAAPTATALAANPGNCSAGNLPRGVDASGVAEGCAPVNLATETTGAAPTATALAANPTNCSAGNYPLGIDASGNVESCTAAAAATSPAAIKASTWCLSTAGSGTTYVGTTTNSSTISIGQFYFLGIDTTNTGNVTFDCNSQGAKAVLHKDGTQFAAGDLVAGDFLPVLYDGTQFVPLMELLSNNPAKVTFKCGTAPSSPAAGLVTDYCTSKIPLFKNEDGTVFNPVIADAGASNNFLTAISAGGVISKSQPAFSNLSGSASTAQGGTGCGATPFATNPQAATYQVLAADFTCFKTITVASGTFPITLVASGTQPTAGQFIKIVNYGTGVLTIARSGQNINGGTASLTIPAGSATAPTFAFVTSDGTNYFASLAGGSSASSPKSFLVYQQPSSAFSAVTCNGSLQTLDSYTIPAATFQVGDQIDLTVSYNKSAAVAATHLAIGFGAGLLDDPVQAGGAIPLSGSANLVSLTVSYLVISSTAIDLIGGVYLHGQANLSNARWFDATFITGTPIASTIAFSIQQKCTSAETGTLKGWSMKVTRQ